MGNAQSNVKTNKKKTLSQIIDYVATNYILTQNFQDMTKLSDMKYCNDLVIMTSKIIANNLDNMEVHYLAQRIKDGVQINEMENDNVIYLDKKNMSKLDVRNKTQKRRLCIAIAKYYIKVAHVFAAIVTTINPTYTYKDATGSSHHVSLMEKHNLPKDAQTKINRINICSQRINALINNQDFDVSKDSKVTIKPKFCDINYDDSSKSSRTFTSEPGIPELSKLYHDKYNYDNGGFTGMTKKMRKNIYEKDVEMFYKTFTGNTKMPRDADGKKTIKTFSQIPLRDFHKSKGCEKDGVFNKEYTGTLKEELFKKYADHVKKMMQTTEKKQNKLLSIIDKLFVFSLNPETQYKEVVVDPKLTEKELQKIVEKTRKLIVDLYLTCENDFLDGLEIFEAIVEKQILDTSKEQIKELEITIEDTLETVPSADVETSVDVETSADAETSVDVETDDTAEPDDTGVVELQKDEPEDASIDVEVSNDTVEPHKSDIEMMDDDGEIPKGVIVGGAKFMNL